MQQVLVVPLRLLPLLEGRVRRLFTLPLLLVQLPSRHQPLHVCLQRLLRPLRPRLVPLLLLVLQVQVQVQARCHQARRR